MPGRCRAVGGLVAGVGVWASLALAGPAWAHGGHASAPHVSAPHFSPPKMPAMHFKPPKMPTMHFTPPKMPKTPASHSGGGGGGKTSQMQLEQAMTAHMNAHAHQSRSIPVSGHAAHHATSSHSGQHAKSLKAKSLTQAAGTAATAVAAGALGAGLGAGLVAAHPAVRASRYHGYGRRYGSYWGRHYYRRRRYYGNRNTISLAQRNLLRLVRDLDSLTPGAQINAVQKTMLQNDLMAVTERPPRPAVTPVQSLANHLVSGLTGRRAPMINTQELASGLKIVMNRANIAAGNTTQAIAASQTLLQAGGVKQPDVVAITADLREIAGVGANNAVNRAQNLLGRPH